MIQRVAGFCRCFGSLKRGVYWRKVSMLFCSPLLSEFLQIIIHNHWQVTGKRLGFVDHSIFHVAGEVF